MEKGDASQKVKFGTIMEFVFIYVVALLAKGVSILLSLHNRLMLFSIADMKDCLPYVSSLTCKRRKKHKPTVLRTCSDVGIIDIVDVQKLAW